MQPALRTPLRLASASRAWLLVYNPNDGSVLGEVEQLSLQDLDALLSEVLAGQKLLACTPPSQRAGWLKHVAQEIRHQQESLALLIATEGGKPLKDAKLEVERAAHTFELCAQEALRAKEELLSLADTPAGATKRSLLRREPIGPVLALSAFNHPLNLLAHQVGSALAAGCAVVFKPSPATPYCAEWLADALVRSGAPSSVAQVTHAEVEVIEALLARPEFQFVSFIGSAKIGWELRKKLAPGTRLALEHGGQAAAMVLADADVDAAVKALIRGAFYHAGQVCISTQRIYLHSDVAERFTQAFVAAAKKLVVGDARSAASDVGPLIRPAEKQRLLEWISEAQSAGAQLLYSSPHDNERMLGPHILRHVPVHCRLWREEAFGPVVCLATFHEPATVYEELARNPYHFQAAVFTSDQARALEACERLSAMTVVVNDHTAWRVDSMPFGGHRQSGLGMGGVRWAVEEQTRLKQVILSV